MFNWIDLLRQAQTSAGFDTLVRQFQLSTDQAQRAMAALLPAFAMGLQRAADPSDPARFFQSMMGDAYRNFWQAAGQSFSFQAQQEGRRLLDQLFGSDDVARRVAHQAADYAGLSIETMQQILPLVTGILAGGMYQWMHNQGRAFQSFAPAPPVPQNGEGKTDPWAELWATWMKAASPENKSDPHPFEALAASFLQAPNPSRQAPEPPPSPSDPWMEMMEKGRDMQMQYLASLQSIFESATKPTEKKG
jgi:hypothetical protein